MPQSIEASAAGIVRNGASPAETYRTLVREVPRLRRYARFLTGEVDGADRLVRNCLSQAIMTASAKPVDSSMRAWLFVIMHDQHIKGAISGSFGLEPQNTSLGLQQAFERLDCEHQKVMLMVGLDGLAHEDTAAALGVSVETIRARLLRARAAMGVLMKTPLPHDSDALGLADGEVSPLI